MEKFVRKFVAIAPEYLEFKTIRKVEYIMQKNKNLVINNNEVKEKMEKLAKECQ